MQSIAHILVRAVVLGSFNLVVCAAAIIQSQTLVYRDKETRRQGKEESVIANIRSLFGVDQFGSDKIPREPDKCFPLLSMLSFFPVLVASLTVKREEQVRNVHLKMEIYIVNKLLERVIAVCV